MENHNISEFAKQLYGRALVWDNHVCVAFADTEQCLPELEKYRLAGVDMIAVNIGDSDIDIETQIRTVACLSGYIDNNAERYQFIYNANDILTAKAAGKLGITFNVEGFYAMGNQLSLLSLYHRIGVRWALLAYNRKNHVAYGCHDADDKGLTPFGYQVVAEMDRLGIIKCCSHMGYNSARDVLAESSLPVIFSHSNPRHLRDHERNIPDDLIKACAKTDGVVGLNGVSLFLKNDNCNTGILGDTIDYLVQLVGARHVGIGLDQMIGNSGTDDFKGSMAQDYWPIGKGYETANVSVAEPHQLLQLTDNLLQRGYTEADVLGILGENLLRVARQVW